MALMASSQPNKTFKFFNSKLHKIRAWPLDFLVQNVGPFTTPTVRGPTSQSARQGGGSASPGDGGGGRLP